MKFEFCRAVVILSDLSIIRGHRIKIGIFSFKAVGKYDIKIPINGLVPLFR